MFKLFSKSFFSATAASGLCFFLGTWDGRIWLVTAAVVFAVMVFPMGLFRRRKRI